MFIIDDYSIEDEQVSEETSSMVSWRERQMNLRPRRQALKHVHVSTRAGKIHGVLPSAQCHVVVPVSISLPVVSSLSERHIPINDLSAVCQANSPAVLIGHNKLS